MGLAPCPGVLMFDSGSVGVELVRIPSLLALAALVGFVIVELVLRPI